MVTHGEGFAVVVHGTAHEVDLSSEEAVPFREYLGGVYGGEWEDWGSSAPYARIEPARMFTFRMKTG